ncbi:MAG: hypothetical protein IJG87_06595 [Ruminococcus sp.]|nr:hypothetical protein [Ruminococcus sp.]
MKRIFHILLGFIVGQVLQLALNGVGRLLYPGHEFLVSLMIGLLIVAAACAGLLLGIKTPTAEEEPIVCPEVFADEDQDH